MPWVERPLWVRVLPLPPFFYCGSVMVSTGLEMTVCVSRMVDFSLIRSTKFLSGNRKVVRMARTPSGRKVVGYNGAMKLAA